MTFLLLVLLAQTPSGPGPIKPLEWYPAGDVPVTLSLGAFTILTETAFKTELAASACRWCAHNGLDDGVRRLFVPIGAVHLDGVRWADITSNITYLAAPVLLFALDAWMVWDARGSWRDWLVDVTLTLEATAAVMSVNQGVKFAVGRERPFVSDLSPAQKASTTSVNDNDLSFFSAHSATTAALTAASGVIAWLRGYRHPWLAWLLGGVVSLVTGTLRLAADKHYFTDVMTGWAFGAGVGLAVPWLVHSGGDRLSVVPGPDGVGIAGRW